MSVCTVTSICGKENVTARNRCKGKQLLSLEQIQVSNSMIYIPSLEALSLIKNVRLLKVPEDKMESFSLPM